MKKMFYLLMLGVFSTYYSFGQIVISSDPVYPQIVFRNTTTNTDRALYSDGEQSGILKYRYDGTNDVYLMHSGNFNSYVPTLTGTGASGNWNINAASATNTTYWGNIGADFANGPGGSNLAWIAAADGTAGTVRPYFAPAIRTWLGIPSGGETLQSVMDRGRVFSGEMLNNTSVGRKFTAYSDAGGFASFGQDYNRAFLSATANDRITLGHIGIDGNYQEKFSVLPNGNVGIGTTSPGFKLDIRNASSDGIRVSTTDNQYVGALLWNSGTVDLSAGGYGTPDLRLMTDGSERLRVLSNGNIGIGTSSPSEKLSVNGNIRSKKIIVSASPWPDYVFDSSYQLTPLHYVEKYIQQNKHLPDVPSAAAVKKDGVDLGDNQAVLLKKIEELTLYIIEQNKELKSLAQKVERLEVSK